MDNKQSDNNSKLSCWGKRTDTEKFLLVITTFCTFLIIYLVSTLLITARSNGNLKQNVCMSEKCIQSAASILQKMDQTVNPCEDFYRFACGNYIRNTIIPDDKVIVSSFSDVSDKVVTQLKQIFEERVNGNDPKLLKLLKYNYNSCMNITKIEKEGLHFIKKTFKELGGWPVLEQGQWNERTFDWKNLLYRLRRAGWRRNFFINLYVDIDLKNSSKRILTIGQPCMPYDRLKKGLNDSSVQATYDYLINLVTLFGSDKLHAIAEMKEVIDFEIKLAKIIVPYEKRKNTTLLYNPTTIKDLQRNFLSIPWLQFINSYLAPIDMFTSEDVVNVAVPKYLEDLEDLLQRTKKRTLANYMFSRLVRDVVMHLPEAFRNKELEYMKTVYGKSQVTPRWKTCVHENGRMYLAMAQVYVQHLFDKSIKNKATELVLNIKASVLEALRKLRWMDPKTKKHALLKAEKMKSFVAYPDELLDEDKVEDHYAGLELNPEAYYLKSIFNFTIFRHMKNIKELREPVLKPNWKSHSYSFYVNAFYNENDNAIEVPAAILQGSFFDSGRPQYMNFGGIGHIIGHEIIHGFDDRGRQHDEDGNLFDWWQPETNKTFSKRSQCLEEQYGNFTIPELEMNLNGLKTLGENIADNGGIKMAYKGYLTWVAKHGEERSLPGLPYTARQMFWISAATSWCTKYKKETLREWVNLSYHSPSYFRVVVPFMNSDYFGRDFECPLGSPMNPKYKCKIW